MSILIDQKVVALERRLESLEKRLAAYEALLAERKNEERRKNSSYPNGRRPG